MVVGLTLGIGAFTLMKSDPEVMGAMAGTTMLLMFLVFMALLLPVMAAAWFAPLLVIFHQEGVIDSMKSSLFACVKNFLPLLVYSVGLFFLAIVATLPILLGWLVLGPMISISVYTGYRDIYLKPKD